MRKVMVSLLVLAFAASVFNPCAMAAKIPSTQKPGEAARAEWTVLVYIAADNDLVEAGYQNIFEMSKVGSTPDLNIVCLFDDTSPEKSYFVKVDKNEEAAAGKLKFKDWKFDADKAVKAKAIPEINTGDPNVLYSFLKKGVELFPANRYFLLFWNHGSGFYSVGDAASAASGDFSGSSDKAVTKGRFSKERLQMIDALRNLDSVAYDDNSGGDSLTQLELKAVLSQLKQETGTIFDVIGFDACLMNNIEVVSQLAPFSRVVIGSEESEPGAGWSYEGFLAPMIKDPKISLEKLSDLLCRTYVKKSTKGLMNKIRFLMSPMPITLASTETVKMADLEALVDDLAKALLGYIQASPAEAYLAITKAQAESLKFSYQFYVDLGDLCEKIARHAKDPVVREKARAVRKAMTGGLFSEGAVISNHQGHTSAATGLSIFFPSFDVPKSALALYKLLDFSRKTKWDDVVEKLVSLTPRVKIAGICATRGDRGINTEVELNSSSSIGALDIKVRIDQFEGGFIARLLQGMKVKKIKFEENEVSIRLEPGRTGVVAFRPVIDSKTQAWLDKNRHLLGQMAMKLTVSLDNGFVLKQGQVSYSDILGIDPLMNNEVLSQLFTAIFTKLDEVNLSPSTPGFAEVMEGSIYPQIKRMILGYLVPREGAFSVENAAVLGAYLLAPIENPNGPVLYSLFARDALALLRQARMSGADPEAVDAQIRVFEALKF